MGIEVRSGCETDAPAIARIHVDAWRSAYRGLIAQHVLDALDVQALTQSWREWITRSAGAGITESAADHELAVATERDEVVGWATFGPARDAERRGSGELAGLYVHPSAAGKGVGSVLVEYVADALHRQGFASAYLWVLEGNRPAERFYERHRWLEDGAVKRDLETEPGSVLVDRARVRSLTEPSPAEHR